MSILVIAIWVISPLILVPIVCILAVKNSKQNKIKILLSNYIVRLYQQGRLSNEEYAQFYYIFNNQQYYQSQQSPQEASAQTNYTYQNYQQVQQSLYRQQSIVYEQKSVTTQQIIKENTQQTYVKKEKNDINTINIILIIGVFFVVLSGLIFVTTTWRILPDFFKVFSVSLFTAMFFVISIIFEKKLRRYKTGMAFFTLGSIFIPITILGIGFFSLLGNWLSLYGKGNSLLGLVAFVSFGAICAVGSAKYQSKYFTWCCLSCITISIYMLLKALYLPTDISILCLSISCSLIVFLGDKITSKALNKESRYKLLLLNFKLYSIINISVICIYATIFSTVSIVSGISILTLALVFLKKSFNESKNPVGIYPFTILTLIGFLKLNVNHTDDGYLLLATLSAVAVLLFSLMNLFGENIKKRLQIASIFILVISFISSGVCFVSLSGWTIPILISMFIIFVCMVYLSIFNHNKIAKHFQPLILIGLFHGIYELFINDRIELSVFMSLLCFVSFLFYYFFKTKKSGFTFRTLTSDIAFLAVCAIGVLVNNYNTACISIYSYPTPLFPTIIYAFFCIGLLCALLSILSLEKEQTVFGKVCSFILPFCFILNYIPMGRMIAKLSYNLNSLDSYTVNEVHSFFILYSIIVIGSIFILFNQNKSEKIKRFLSSTKISVPALGIIGFYQAKSNFDNVLYPAYLWVIMIYLILNLICFEEYRRKHSSEQNFIILAYFHLSSGLLLLASFFTTSEIIYCSNKNIPESVYAVLTPALISAILYGIYAVRTFILKKEENFYFKQLYLFSRIAIMCFAAICPLIYLTKVDYSLFYLLVCSGLILLSYFAFYIRKENSFCIVPLLFIYPIFFDTIDLWRNQSNYTLLLGISTCIIFLLLLGAGRLLHPKFYNKTIVDKKSRILFNWIDVINIIAPISLILMDDKYWSFSGFVMLAVYVINYLNRFGKGVPNSMVLTAMSMVLCIAYWNQPFFEIYEIIRAELLILPIVLFAIALKFIWKNQKNVMNIVLFIVSILSIIILAGDAIRTENVIDILIIGIISLAMLIVSFLMKKKSWFILSSVTLVLMAVYMTRSFWLSLAWWVYLLFAGVILISIAAIKEKFK